MSVLYLNLVKCVQCMLSLKDSAGTYSNQKATIDGYALSTVESVIYLGITSLKNAKWTTRVGEILRKCLGLSFFERKLLFICTFAEACVLLINLPCPPSIFPELLKRNFLAFSKIASVGAMSRRPLTWTLGGGQHPLHGKLSKPRWQYFYQG